MGKEVKKVDLLKVLTDIKEIGRIAIRFGFFAALVYGIYYIGKLIEIVNFRFGTFPREAITLLAEVIVIFTCAIILEIAIPKIDAKPRVAALISVIAGSILLLPSPIAGIIVLIGGFLILFYTEIRSLRP